MKKLSIQTLLKRVAFALPVTLVGLFASANAYGSIIINLDSLLANPSFENGTGAVDPITHVGCPTGWTCAGSPAPGGTAYTVTAAQYTAGSDGLSGGRIVPFGADAGYAPTILEGSGSMQQNSLIDSSTYVVGNTYNVDLYVGTPNILPFSDPTCPPPGTPAACPAGPVGRIQGIFLANGVAAVGGTFDVTIPGKGQWLSFPLSFTPTANGGQTIGFELFVDSGPAGNDHVANFDIGAVPEPATFALMGLGLLGLGVVRKKLRS